MAELLYWVWLGCAVTPGTDTYAKLRTSFSSPKDIYSAGEEELRHVLGARYTATIERLCDKNLFYAKRMIDFCAVNDVGILTYDDSRFPARLREIKEPPVLLYYMGTLPDFDKAFCVSIVGSREHNAYAMRQTFEIAHDLAVAGTTVVSGMARGIDGIALAAALSGGGKTVAVIGSGIDVIYPKEHSRLARLIASHGVILSEYPPGTPPYRTNFPKRNRIISALGNVTLVTAGTLNSGALITAHYAKEQGKDLYALPGNVDDPYCAATALLLREGACAAVCAEDILFAYEKRYPSVINVYRLLEKTDADMERVLEKAHVAISKKVRKEKIKKGKETDHRRTCDGADDTEEVEYPKTQTKEAGADGEHMPADDEARRKKVESLTENLRRVYDLILANGECTPDALVTAETPPSKVLAAITALEIKGLIRQLPGGRIARTH